MLLRRELRKKVFSWSNTEFPLAAGRSLKLTRQPVVTVVGKAFYDKGHAGGSNRRSYDSELAVWKLHPVMQMTESNAVAAQPPASKPAATPEAQEQFVVLTQPVTIRIFYGTTTLAPGTRLQVVSRDAGTVNVRYMDQVYPIPAASAEGR